MYRDDGYFPPHVKLSFPRLESPRSRTSLGTVSSTAEVRTTESTTAEEPRSNVKQPKVTLRRKRVESWGCEDDLMELDPFTNSWCLSGYLVSTVSTVTLELPSPLADALSESLNFTRHVEAN